MSVYIKGMEMPTSCAECFAFKSNASGQLFCKAKRIAFGKEDAKWLPKCTPSWCPLIPVPPHGDLIDLKAPFEAQFYDDLTEEWIEKTGTVEDALYGCMVLDMPPVVIPAEEGE